MKLSKKLWHGNDIWLFTLTGANTSLEITNLGCTIVSFKVIKDGDERNIVLGYETASSYLEDIYYVGSIVGRYAGRIGGAALEIEGQKYPLIANEKHTVNHLHGGVQGFNKKNFIVVDELANADKASVSFRYQSFHLEEGYPGDLDLQVSISLNRLDEVAIIYEAHADRPTFINLTHHCYFNLSGTTNEPGHQLQVNASEFLPSDTDFLPTGEICSVDGTRYDFRRPVNLEIGEKLNDFAGYNDYLILKKDDLRKPGAILTHRQSGLSIGVRTTFPGLLLYTGDYLGAPFKKNQGICLETQGYPDAPNHPNFPSALLQPGNKYYHETKFNVENIR